jgi:hypothetical protein
MIILSLGRIGLAGNRRYQKNLVKFPLNINLEKLTYINSNILIAVTQPPFTKKLGLPSAEKKLSLKLAELAI